MSTAKDRSTGNENRRGLQDAVIYATGMGSIRVHISRRIQLGPTTDKHGLEYVVKLKIGVYHLRILRLARFLCYIQQLLYNRYVL